MKPLNTYKHKDTGKVGEYSDAVAALFPKLEPFVVSDEESTPKPKHSAHKSAPIETKEAE